MEPFEALDKAEARLRRWISWYIGGLLAVGFIVAIVQMIRTW